MIVTELSLNQFIELAKKRADNCGYRWIVMLIGRTTEAEKYYAEIEKNKASLHDLTNEKIAFVFSKFTPKRNIFLRKIRRPAYEGYMCPFINSIFAEKLGDNDGDFYIFKESFKDINWTEKHSQSITEFINNHGIKERELPGLYIYSVDLGKEVFIPLIDGICIYDYLRKFVESVNEVDSKYVSYENKLKELGTRKFFDIEGILTDYKGKTEEETLAIKKILKGENDYKSQKHLIEDKKTRDNIKKYFQYKRQLGINNQKYAEDKQVYDELKKKIKNYNNDLITFFEKLSEQATLYRYIKNTSDTIAAQTRLNASKDLVGMASYREALRLVGKLKNYIENQDGYKLFYPEGTPVKREENLQLIFRPICSDSIYDVNREVNNGRGPVDYKISFGKDNATVIEFKLANNNKLKQNLQYQVNKYKEASETKYSVVAIMYFDEKEKEKLNRILKELSLLDKENIILIDATSNKVSASNLKE